LTEKESEHTQAGRVAGRGEGEAGSLQSREPNAVLNPRTPSPSYFQSQILVFPEWVPWCGTLFLSLHHTLGFAPDSGQPQSSSLPNHISTLPIFFDVTSSLHLVEDFVLSVLGVFSGLLMLI